MIELSRVGNCRNITKGNHCWLKLAIFMCKEKLFFFFCQKQVRARATLRSIILGVKFQKRCIYHAYHTCKYTTCVIFLTVYNFALTTAGQKPLLLGDRYYLSKAQSLLNHLLQNFSFFLPQSERRNTLTSLVTWHHVFHPLERNRTLKEKHIISSMNIY